MDKRYDDTPNLLNKLHDELLAATVTPTLVEGDSDGATPGTWVHIVAPTATEAAVDAVVAAHNPHRPPTRTLAERRAAKAAIVRERAVKEAT